MKTQSLELTPLNTPAQPPQADHSAAPALPALDEVIAQVRRDCLDRPEKYLEEVHVPNGGE